ncbi:3-deoxy-7-phosphoheptulonate synthase [Candidatus Sumerlaeota bacterium]|nr:3-deoxy-7-phosphoheptulonate synthase [Candidatus Sumerlaeota bacterium]
MIIVMQAGASEAQIESVVKRVKQLGYDAHISKGEERTVIGCVGHADKSPLQQLAATPGVESVVPILKPWKLVGRQFKPESTVIDVDGELIGGDRIALMAGPCSVETEERTVEIARAVKAAGARFLRGGAFKPRTSPYAFQGLEREGLEILRAAKRETGLRIVTELLSVRDIELVCEYTDIIQIGARNCQNFALLKELGGTGKPVLFKRGMSTTLKEYLQAAEYIVAGGNPDVMLCERGIRTFEDSTRNTFDLNAVALLKQWSHLPMIADPSHGTGIWSLVAPMAAASVAAGADGLIIEVHTEPEQAWSDGQQSLRPDKFQALVEQCRRVAEAVGRSL